ncbi:MAG: hypothetical protein ACTSVU_03780 [Promethearchaeota archaeon]
MCSLSFNGQDFSYPKTKLHAMLWHTMPKTYIKVLLNTIKVRDCMIIFAY